MSQALPSYENWRDPAVSWAITIRAARADAARLMRSQPADPAVEARYLPLHLVEALVGAWKHQTYGWMVAEQHAPELRSMGMVGFGRGREGQGVTAFGWAVRTALMAEDA